MLRHKRIIYCSSRTKNKTNLYITQNEMFDLLANLSFNELQLYTYCRFAPNKNYKPDDFSIKKLSTFLNLAESTIKNIRSSLKKKGYLVIDKFVDNKNNSILRVVVGKEVVTLYNLGIDVDIIDSGKYATLLTQFPIDDPDISVSQREHLIDEMNTYYKEHYANG